MRFCYARQSSSRIFLPSKNFRSHLSLKELHHAQRAYIELYNNLSANAPISGHPEGLTPGTYGGIVQDLLTFVAILKMTERSGRRGLGDGGIEKVVRGLHDSRCTQTVCILIFAFRGCYYLGTFNILLQNLFQVSKCDFFSFCVSQQ